MAPRANQRGGDDATQPDAAQPATPSDRKSRWDRRVNAFEIVIGELPPENMTDPKVIRARSAKFLTLIDHPEEKVELTGGQVTGLTEFYCAAVRDGKFEDVDQLTEEVREKHELWMKSEDERIIEKAAARMAKDREHEPPYDDWIKAQKCIRTLERLVIKNREAGEDKLKRYEAEAEEAKKAFTDCQQELKKAMTAKQSENNNPQHLVAKAFTQARQTNRADAARIASLQAENERLQNRVEVLEALSRLTIEQHSEAVPEKAPAEKKRKRKVSFQ